MRIFRYVALPFIAVFFEGTCAGLFDTGAEISAIDQQFVDKHKNLFTLVKNKAKASEAGGK